MWRFVLLAFGVLVVAALVFHRSGTEEYCSFCGSTRHSGEVGVGPILLTSSTESTSSHIFRDFLDADHAHEWIQCSHSEWSLWGGFIACGRTDLQNRFAMKYAWDRDFRSFVRSKMESGELTREEAREMVTASELTPSARALYVEHFGREPIPLR